MAEDNFDGKTVGIYISTNLTTPAWKLAVCLTSNNFSRKADTMDTSSKCDNGWSSFKPGRRSWSISGEGLAAAEPATNRMSYQEIDAIFLAGVEVLVKVADSPTTGTNVDYSGHAVLTSLEETYNDNDSVKFTFEFTGKGAYTNNLS
jgi:hypothetical protein